MLCDILKKGPPPLYINIMDSHGNADTTLRLAVGIALVPVGALVALTRDGTERNICEISPLLQTKVPAVGRKYKVLSKSSRQPLL